MCAASRHTECLVAAAPRTRYVHRMTLDVTPFANAVQRLREGLQRCEHEPKDEQIRDGLIQRFEFTYELSHKMLKRYVKQTAASPAEIDRMSFADLIRTGNAQGLLRSDWPAWRRFREMRARTSHTYNLDLAIDAGRRVSLDEMAALTEAFSESDLPYKVDLVDWHGIDGRFQRIIARERVALTRPVATR
jgi:nucleotidyltransferase substrate binding protein (TIGR01987 family)